MMKYESYRIYKGREGVLMAISNASVVYKNINVVMI